MIRKKKYPALHYDNFSIVPISSRGDRYNITIPKQMETTQNIDINNRCIVIPDTNQKIKPKEGDVVGFYIIDKEDNNTIYWIEGKIVKNDIKYYEDEDMEEESEFNEELSDEEEEFDSYEERIEEYDSSKKYAIIDIRFFYMDDEIDQPYEVTYQFNDFNDVFGFKKISKNINKRITICKKCKKEYPAYFKYCYACGEENIHKSENNK